MEPISLDNVYNVYSILDGKDGALHNQLLGRVVVTASQLLVLSDYHGLLQDLQGPADDRHMRRWRAWANGSHSRVVSLADLQAGYHPELMQELSVPAPTETPEPPHETWYRVERQDLENPLLVQFKDGQAYMHGQPLAPEELQGLLDGAKAGTSRIRYHQPQEDVAKMESGLVRLVKADKYLNEALAAVSQAQQAGHIDPGVLEALHKAIFYDPMVPGVKNKKAFHDEIQQQRDPQGVHVMLDGNDFGSINKMHGHAVGDQAIKAMGGAIRDSVNEVVGPEHQDLWRFGGDEFATWMPSYEHAARFLRTLRSKLEAVPPVGGTHQLSMSAGVGKTHADADVALNQHAKAAKKAAGYLPGQAKMHVHSLVPGHEGQIPVDPEVAKQPPPEPKPAVAPATKPVG